MWVDPMHNISNWNVISFENQVIMIAHDDKTIALKPHDDLNLTDQFKKILLIIITVKNILPIISPLDQMIDPTAIF